MQQVDADVGSGGTTPRPELSAPQKQPEKEQFLWDFGTSIRAPVQVRAHSAAAACAARIELDRSRRSPPKRITPRTDAAMWLKRYSGLLRLHAALLSPAEGFLFPVFLSSSPSPQLLSSAALCLRAAPAPRTPFTFYTSGTATRCTVQATPRYSLTPLPQFTLS